LIARPTSLFRDHERDDGNADSDATSAHRLAAVGASLLGVLGATGTYISLRAMGTKAHTLHTLIYFSLYCIIVSSILMVVQGTPIVIPGGWLFLLFLFLIGIFGLIAQILLVMGFQLETASRGSLATYTLILFSGTLDQIVLHVRLAVLPVVGAMIIISSAIYIVLTKPPPDNKPASKQVRWVEDTEDLELRSNCGPYDEVESQSEAQSEGEDPLQKV